MVGESFKEVLQITAKSVWNLYSNYLLHIRPYYLSLSIKNDELGFIIFFNWSLILDLKALNKHVKGVMKGKLRND